jgi:hypothetical protein
MNIKHFLVILGKLLLCIVAYMLGMMLGGMLATALRLQQPILPEGMDASSAGLYMILESPVLALVLIGLSRFLSGSFPARSLMLGSLTWVSNSLNNQIEASYFGSMSTGFWFTIVTFLVPSFLVAAAVAWLFPPASNEKTFVSSAKSFFSSHAASSWAWRLVLGAVLFMPIYYFFGLLVIPFTIEYYQQGLYGLQVPPLNQLLVILFVRSVFFFLTCLPIVIAWQSSKPKLMLYLGLALFYLVGLQALLIANWMPWSLRLPHLLEILADEFVYAWALVMVLTTEPLKLPTGWRRSRRYV